MSEEYRKLYYRMRSAHRDFLKHKGVVNARFYELHELYFSALRALALHSDSGVMILPQYLGQLEERVLR